MARGNPRNSCPNYRNTDPVVHVLEERRLHGIRNIHPNEFVQSDLHLAKVAIVAPDARASCLPSKMQVTSEMPIKRR